MERVRYEIVVCRGADELTLEEVAAAAGLHPELVERFVEFGLLEPVVPRAPRALFAVEAVWRARAIERLRRDIGVNLPGVGVILDLVERLRRLELELERLRAREP